MLGQLESTQMQKSLESTILTEFFHAKCGPYLARFLGAETSHLESHKRYIRYTNVLSMF